MKRQGRRVAIVRQQFQFLKKLRSGELIVIQSGFVAVSRKHFRFLHRSFDIGAESMAATSDFTAVEASLKTGNSDQLPPPHRKAAEKHLVTADVAKATGLT